MATTAWDPTKLYGVGERVTDGGKEWISVKSNKAIKPGSRPGTWVIAPPLPTPAPTLVIPLRRVIAAFDGRGGFRVAAPEDFPAFNGTAADIVDLFGSGPRDATHVLASDGTIVLMTGGGGGAVSSVAGRTGAVILTYLDIGGLSTVAHTGAYSDLTGLPSLFDGVYSHLSGIPSTFAPAGHHTTHETGGSDVLTLAQSQITGLTAALALKAPLASPALTGTPTAPTASPGTNTTQLATTAFVEAAVSAGTAGALLIANNLSDLASAATARSNLGISTVGHTGAYADLTGAPTIPTISSGTVVLKGDGSGNAINAIAGTDYAGIGSANIFTAQNQFKTGTITTSKPLTLSQTWNAGAVTFKGISQDITDSASASASLLMDLLVAGSSQFSVRKDGVITVGTIAAPQVSGLAAIATSGSASDLIAGTVPIARVPTGSTGTTVPFGNDSRFSDARTPTAHAASHAAAGSDPVTLTEAQVTNLVTDLALLAPLASPTFTGTPAAPTAAGGTNTTQLATTAFVTAAVSGGVAGALLIANNLSDLASTTTARSNLGISAVGHTGAYADLTGTPTIPTITGTLILKGSSGNAVAAAAADVVSLFSGTPTGAKFLRDDGTIALVAYSQVTGTPSLAAIATSGSASDLTGGTVPIARIPTGSTGTTVPLGNDSRFSDARTPTAHAASHASGGGDAVTLAESQVTNLTTDLAAKAPLASPTFTGTPAAPTPTAGDSTTKLATTAFVGTAVSGLTPPANASINLFNYLNFQ